MEIFSNEIIDTAQLPKFEEVHFTALHPNYWKVLLINLVLLFLISAIGMGLTFFYNVELAEFQIPMALGFVFLVVLVVAFMRIGFIKKGFAFRNHDVLFRNGIIATNTTIIPYNRVQHVALHEGLMARYFGLATIQIFTAGGRSSDIEVPGIRKEEAENIKQLLMGKIQKQL
jgi:membrane protein YdbS with pleckstrin-like domain